MDWLKVDIKTTPEAVEALNETLLALSPSGFVIGDEEEDVTATVFLAGTISPESARATLEHALDNAHASGLSVRPATIDFSFINDEDWVDNYRKFFHVIRIGKLVIKPSWEDAGLNPGEVAVELDPGLAFGTGAHPTTAGCLHFIQEIIAGGEVVFDLGTGSGILAIAAAKLGSSRVIAIDDDAEAIEVAVNNARHNGVDSRIDFIISDFSDIEPTEIDILVANLTAPLIIRLMPEFAQRLVGLKIVISSGIMRSQLADVAAALGENGYKVEKTFEEGDWVSVVSRRV